MLVNAFLVFLLSVASVRSKPNVILIIGDDVGNFNVGYNGNPEVKTPHIDALAQEGARFDRMYAYFWCSPSRASIMSGRFPVHVYQTQAPQSAINNGLPTAMTTLADKMKSAGYITVQAGKWHLGSATTGHLPVNRGFDTSLGFFSGAENHFNQSLCSDPLCLHADGQLPLPIVPPALSSGIFDLWHDQDAGTISDTDKGWGDDRWTDHVIAEINNTASSDQPQPLFAYLALAAAHSPLQAPAEALAPFPSNMYHDRRMYNGLMSSLDSNVGRLVSALKTKGMWDNTILFFVSDNGGPIYFNQPNMTHYDAMTGGGANNYPLTGGKLSLLEGGVRVASFAAGGALPQAAQGGIRFSQLMTLADIHATLCDFAGANIADPKGVAAGMPPVDGLSLLPLLRGDDGEANATAIRDMIPLALNVTQGGVMVEASALIVGDMKLIVGDMHFYITPQKVFPTEDYAYVWDDEHTLKCGTTGCLFNLTADPSEQHDLAASQPGMLAFMHERLGTELGKKYENDCGKSDGAAFLKSLIQRKGFIGPFAQD